MRTTIAIATLAAALALGACNTPLIPPGNYGTITGTVTSSSGQPIAGVVVQVDYGPSGTSGADGKYSVSNVPISTPTSPAHVAVTSAPSGYRLPSPRDDVQVQAGQTTANINFVLSKV